MYVSQSKYQGLTISILMNTKYVIIVIKIIIFIESLIDLIRAKWK